MAWPPTSNVAGLLTALRSTSSVPGLIVINSFAATRIPSTPNSTGTGQCRRRAFTCSFNPLGPSGLRYAQSVDTLRRRAADTVAGIAICKLPRDSSMLILKLRINTLSSGGITHSALPVCWRRSNWNSSPKACQVTPSWRHTICTTHSRSCSSISVTSRGSSEPLPSPPKRRSIRGNAIDRSN